MSMDKDFSITPAEGAGRSEQADAASQLADLPAGAPILVSACLLGQPCRYDGRAKAYPAFKPWPGGMSSTRFAPKLPAGFPHRGRRQSDRARPSAPPMDET